MAVRAPHTCVSARPPLRAALVWLRRDLRLSDHEPLTLASSEGYKYAVPLACLDPADVGPRKIQGLDPAFQLGIPKMGPNRLDWYLQALRSLDASLPSGLVFRLGAPEDALEPLLSSLGRLGLTHVDLLHHIEPGPEAAASELRVQRSFAAELRRLGLQGRVRPRFGGLTLHHPDDVAAGTGLIHPLSLDHPMDVDLGASDGWESDVRRAREPSRFAQVPVGMTEFRKKVQGTVGVRGPLKTVQRGDLPSAPAEIDRGRIPESADAAYREMGLADAWERLGNLTGGICSKPGDERGHTLDPRSEIPFDASEEGARARLRHFLYGSSHGAQRSSSPTADRHPLLVEADAAAPAGQAKPTEAGPGPRAPGEAPVRGYGYRRADAVGVDNSAKLSVFLSTGLLSPRTVYAELQAAIAAHSLAGPASEAEASNERDPQLLPGDGQPGSAPPPPPPPSRSDLDWMVMCLTIRDHYIFTALRENDNLMRAQGIKEPKPGQDPSSIVPSWPGTTDPAALRRWASGTTGLPYVDASMRELAATGYTSNRGRQNAASLLARGLQVDWRLGCQVFESLLIDHDWALNAANWAYVAGVGTDPRGSRHFCTVSQGETYDPAARLARLWIPELNLLAEAQTGDGGGSDAEFNPRLCHRPWGRSSALTLGPGKEGPGFDEGEGYLALVPIVDVSTQIAPDAAARSKAGAAGAGAAAEAAVGSSKSGKGGKGAGRTVPRRGKDWIDKVVVAPNSAGN